MPNLTQGTLSFASTKRTSSIPHGKKTSGVEKGKSKRVEIPVEAQNDEKPKEALEISSDEEGPTAREISVPAKRTRASTKRQSPSSGTGKQVPQQVPQSEKLKPFPAEIERVHLDVEDRAGRYRRYHHEVRSKMGYLHPIHSERQNKIHQMLRFFDMSYEFGPCVGMTRLERWERAETLGLNPPAEVRDILLTKEGIDKAEYAQCVLYDEV